MSSRVCYFCRRRCFRTWRLDVFTARGREARRMCYRCMKRKFGVTLPLPSYQVFQSYRS